MASCFRFQLSGHSILVRVSMVQESFCQPNLVGRGAAECEHGSVPADMPVTYQRKLCNLVRCEGTDLPSSVKGEFPRHLGLSF